MRVDARGYVRITDPEHPLANKGGTLARHRQVLWDAIGRPEISLCYNCRWPLPWIRPDDIPGQFAHRYVVNVDHINGIPGDDRVANLRPACFWCNGNRTWEPFAPTIWRYMTDVLRMTPPWQRPSARHTLASWAEKAFVENTVGDKRILEVVPLKDGLIDFFDELEKIYDR